MLFYALAPAAETLPADSEPNFPEVPPKTCRWGSSLKLTMSTASISTDLNQLAGKYLTVFLDQESYGIAVLKVREIIRLQKITPVPQVPHYVKGVINLRGRVIPVIDLRLKFGLDAEVSERTCIVVVQVQMANGSNQMGLIVDNVEEVVTLNGTDIEPTPEFGTRLDTSCLLGLAKVKGVVKTLLDIDRVVCGDDLGQIQSMI